MVHVPAHETWIRGAEREVEQVIDDVQEDDDAAPAHRTGGVGRVRGRETAIADRPRRPAGPRHAHRRPDVRQHRNQQNDPRSPQELAGSENGSAYGAQARGVRVELGRSLEDFEIAEQMCHHEQEQHEPGDRHDRLLADERADEHLPAGHPDSGRGGVGTVG